MTPAPILRITTGEVAGTVLRLQADSGTLGRRLTNTYVVADRTVSRLHARLTRLGGAVVVTDLGSTGGTRLEGAPVNAPTVLHHTDEIVFGAVTAVFEDPRPPTARAGWRSRTG